MCDTINSFSDKRIEMLQRAYELLNQFDTHTFEFYFKKYQYCKKQFKNKKVIFIIGASQVGKSTTIHQLAGTKFIKDHPYFIFENYNAVNKHLHDVLVSYGNTTCYPHQSKNMTPIIVHDNDTNEDYIIVDTPGINGSVVDKEINILRRNITIVVCD